MLVSRLQHVNAILLHPRQYDLFNSSRGIQEIIYSNTDLQALWKIILLILVLYFLDVFFLPFK